MSTASPAPSPGLLPGQQFIPDHEEVQGRYRLRFARTEADLEEIQRLPVRLSGLTDSLTVITSRLPESISVRVRGNRLQLLTADLLESQRGYVSLDLARLGVERVLQNRPLPEANVV